jgi:hypothetical protein
MSDIFICYAREDPEHARRMAEALEAHASLAVRRAFAQLAPLGSKARRR